MQIFLFYLVQVQALRIPPLKFAAFDQQRLLLSLPSPTQGSLPNLSYTNLEVSMEDYSKIPLVCLPDNFLPNSSSCSGSILSLKVKPYPGSPMHNVQIVQYLLLSTEQAGTYLQSSLVWHHLTYINPSLFDCKQNMENSIFVSFKL